MSNVYLNDQIQRLKKQIEDLKRRKKLQGDQIDFQINQLQGQIINCQKTLDQK